MNECFRPLPGHLGFACGGYRRAQSSIVFCTRSAITAGIIIERERQRTLEPVRPCNEHLHAAPERICRNPRLVRTGGVPAACNYCRIDGSNAHAEASIIRPASILMWRSSGAYATLKNLIG